MSDALAELESLISGMSPKELAEFDRLAAEELSQPWLPNPGPQTEAYLSDADLLLFGGAAGGGKSSLIIGLASGPHKNVVIFRRVYSELNDIAEQFLETMGSRNGWRSDIMRYRHNGRMVEFGALEKPGSEKIWRGRPHDLICYDEGGELSVEKVQFILGWLRSTDPKQRCRAVIASNPPTGGEGAWMMEWFAPWLDPLFRNPASPGELRWAFQNDQDTVWVDGPGKTLIDGEEYEHLSRTFIPSLLADNPYLKDTGYRARLQSMPEPLRSQLLHGDFLAGREDHAWQVIPTEWVRLANERWEVAEKKTRTMVSLAADIAMGGDDETAIATLHSDAWFAPIVSQKEAASGVLPSEIAARMLMLRRDGADLSVDGTGGWGSGVRSHLVRDHEVECASIVFSAGSSARTKDQKLGYKNLRSQLYWQFREALDPDSGEDIKLPPDQRLTAELTAARYLLRGTDILIETKDEIRKRVGSSTDRGDAVVMAWHRRASHVRRSKKPKITPRSGGWMAR